MTLASRQSTIHCNLTNVTLNLALPVLLHAVGEVEGVDQLAALKHVESGC
jgi:hypothetical protein